MRIGRNKDDPGDERIKARSKPNKQRGTGVSETTVQRLPLKTRYAKQNLQMQEIFFFFSHALGPFHGLVGGEDRNVAIGQPRSNLPTGMRDKKKALYYPTPRVAS